MAGEVLRITDSAKIRHNAKPGTLAVIFDADHLNLINDFSKTV